MMEGALADFSSNQAMNDLIFKNNAKYLFDTTTIGRADSIDCLQVGLNFFTKTNATNAANIDSTILGSFCSF